MPGSHGYVVFCARVISQNFFLQSCFVLCCGNFGVRRGYVVCYVLINFAEWKLVVVFVVVGSFVVRSSCV